MRRGFRSLSTRRSTLRPPAVERGERGGGRWTVRRPLTRIAASREREGGMVRAGTIGRKRDGWREGEIDERIVSGREEREE